MLIRIEADYFCCGVEVENGIIKDAAPILKWAIGKEADYLFKYLHDRGILIKWEEVNATNQN